MIIKKYSCQRFAGIKDKSIDFLDGINVLLGENESGKSTLIEGIHSVMFQSIKYDKRSALDKKFCLKFMPIPNGDVIDGQMMISNDQGDYLLSKEWGTSPSVLLVTPKAEKIKSEDKINEILKEVFRFGEGTFSNILFSKQVHIREALEKIIDSQETTSEVGTLLRKAIMELDGVSIDDLGLRIDAEIDRLFKRWDVDRNYPENGRGINNPYKTGIGEVVTYFYKKERLRLDMEEARAKEIHFDQICNQLKTLELKISELKCKKEAMEQLEGDVITRSLLEPKTAQYDKDQAVLMKINQEWPQNEMRLKQLEEELKILAGDYEKLEGEKVQAGKVKDKEVLMKNLSKVVEIKQRTNETAKELKGIKNITRENIMALEANHNGMITTEAKMKAGVMIGKLTHYSGNEDLIITKDFEEPVTIKAGDTFQANGFMKIESENHFGIEIKSGDINFATLRAQYAEYKKNLESLLLACNVKNIAEAKLNKEKIDDFKRNLLNSSVQINDLLGEETYESLRKKIEDYGDLSNVRSIEAIESAMKTINDKKIELLSTQKSLAGIVNDWRREYKSIDELLEKIVAIKIEQKTVREQLEKLAPLPAEYENADMFRSKLLEIRKSYETDQASLPIIKEDYYNSEKNLPELTYEELIKEHKLVEDQFSQKLENGKKLLKIKAAFESTRAKIDENSFAPVAEAFSKYVVQLTNGNFTAGDIDNSFKLKLEKDQQTDIPIDLLSTGTYDSVALALRLSILEYILGDTKGFMILDDCLVDLDPCRKETAVQLIKSFADKHQVIFTTCSPETAELLGGNLIQM